MSEKKKKLQWHPAFVAGMQIEFGEEARFLTFNPEHLLGTKPMQIDILIKKDSDHVLHKNIGRIFRKHNIIEYKAPGDYLSIDDFYKVYGYTCFYKSNTRTADSIKFQDLTITLVSESYPRKLIRHLQHLLAEYKKHKKDILYESIMDIIVKANPKMFEKEGDIMCEALEELMKDELEAQMQKGKEIGQKIGQEIGQKMGILQGERQGETRVNQLNQKLIALGRMDDMLKSVSDTIFQQKLFKEFNL